MTTATPWTSSKDGDSQDSKLLGSEKDAGAGRRLMLFAEQREKYQARYNEGQERITHAAGSLATQGDTVKLVRSKLRELSKAILSGVRKSLRTRYAAPGDVLPKAFLLAPVFRLLTIGEIRFKLFVLAGIVGIGLWAASLLAKAEILPVLIPYLLLVAVCYLLEKRRRLKPVFDALKEYVPALKALALAHIYENQAQRAEVLGGVQFSVNVNGAEEINPPSRPDDGLVPGAYILTFGSIARFRLEQSGRATAFAWDSDHVEFVNRFEELIAEQLAKSQGFIQATFPPLATYGATLQAKQAALKVAPRLERLLQQAMRIEKIWEDTIVSDPVFDFLLRRIDLFNMQDEATPPGILLYGYPGNGKSHLALKIAESVGARLEHVHPTLLNSTEAVRKTFSRARENGPVVLFVEGAERVFPRPGSEHAAGNTREVSLAWHSDWTSMGAWQSGVWVIMSVQSEQGLHPDLLRVFGTSKVEIAAPNEAGRGEILRRAVRQAAVPGTLPDWIAGATNGASVHDLYEIVKETKLHCLPNAPSDEQWRAAVKHVRGADAAFRDEKKTWDALILPADVKDKLRAVCRILQNAEQLRAKGVPVPNILLYGPPGTGKTEIGRTLANESGVKFLYATTADLKAEHVGGSAQRVRELFAKARNSAPAILFIDEFENVAASREGGGGDAFTRDIVNELLTQMDGATKQERQVFVLAATNLPDRIDPAIKSRFQEKIPIELPDTEARAEILKSEMLRRPRSADLDVDEVAKFLAARLARRSGRDLVKLVDNAMQHAVIRAPSLADVCLTREALLAQVTPQGREVPEAQIQKVWSEIVLKPAVKEQIVAKVRLFNTADKAAPTGLLLTGPPGTGKTEIARKIAESSSAHFMELTNASLKSQYVGGSGQNVKRIWDEARARGRAVLFIDECDGVFTRRGSVDGDKATSELVNEFLAGWDGMNSEGQVWVIGATNKKERLDEAILSRFGAPVEIGLPDAAERLAIARLEMKKRERAGELVPDFIGPETTGFSGRTLAVLAKDVCTLAAEARQAVTPEMWKAAIKRHRASGPNVDPDARWDSLVLANETLQSLKTVCDALQHVEALRKQGIEPPRGALLFGPPGTGKTQIARTLANESGLAFVAAGPADLKAGYVGQSGQMVRSLFERARAQSPCILFVDEIESLAAKRTGNGGDGFTNEIVNQLLTELDGVKKQDTVVFLLAATNHPEQIDPAVLSRFGEKIEIPKPDQQQRQRLFEIALRKKRTDFEVALVSEELARRTGGMSGRDIASLVDRAAQVALRRALHAKTPDQVRMAREDLLGLFEPTRKQISEAELAEVWSKIVLAREVKDSILSKIRIFNAGDKAAPKGLLLSGPPGTGKTEIARTLAKSTNCQFMALTNADLKAGFVGQSGQAAKRVWEKARSYGRCVVFVDECDGVFRRRGSVGADTFTEELVAEFIAGWDGMSSNGQVWVVGATNNAERIDEAVMSRFGTAVEIGLPGLAERLELLRLEFQKLERPEVGIPEQVGRDTAGMAGRDLAKLAADVCTLAAERKTAITAEVFGAVLQTRAKAASASIDSGASWDTLVLSPKTLDALQTLSEALKHIDVLRSQGIEPPRGVLLYGPPGTGKTQIARTMANESGLAFIAASPADLKAGFVGQSGQKARELFERARAKAPCILFVDEIDAVASRRGASSGDAFTGEIVNQLLTEIDGVTRQERTVFLLAATNRPDQIDPALLSRFTEKIEIPNPDLGQRAELFEILLRKKPVDFDVREVARELAEHCGEISGRDIRNAVDLATQKALSRALKAGHADKVSLRRDDLLGPLASSGHQVTAES